MYQSDSNRIIDPKSLQQLFTEFEILHLIYHRNSKQHGSSLWWKHFNILHRKLRKILSLTIDIDEISSKSQLTKLRFTKTKKQKTDKLKIKTKHSKTIIHKKTIEIQTVARFLIKKLLPDCYYRFFGVIELGQFITLGFTLIGLISRIYCILTKFDGVEANLQRLNAIESKLLNDSQSLELIQMRDYLSIHDDGLGEEIGEVVEVKKSENTQQKDVNIGDKRKLPGNVVDDIFEDTSKVGSSADGETEDRKLEKKKKSSSSTIDDIFGSSSNSNSSSAFKIKKKKKTRNIAKAMDDIFGF